MPSDEDRSVAERIAEQLTSAHYRRNHEWGMTEPVMGLRAFSEDKFYKELAAWIRREFKTNGDAPCAEPDRRIDTLNLPVRAWNVLHRADIYTIGDLRKWDKKKLLRQKNCGKVTIGDINQALAEVGLAPIKE